MKAVRRTGSRGRKPRRASRLSEGTGNVVFDYRLEYEGKTPTHAVLAGPKASPERILSVGLAPRPDWFSRLCFGENSGILRHLCDDPCVCGKVNLVYIDPPFATGSRLSARDADHAYDDVVAGAEFIEFLRQRIILLRELLAPTGSIYVHLDGKKAFPMKVIMDEIFGPASFRNFITRKKSNNKNYTHRQYGNISDYILFYTKTSRFTWNRPYDPWTDAHPPKEYHYVEEGTGRHYMKVPVHAPGERSGETGKPWRGKLPPPGKHWQYPPAVLDEMDAKGEIYWSPNGNPRRKIYLDESSGIPAQDIWLHFRDAHNQNIHVTGYPTEKNLPMLERIVQASSDEGDLVLDCFTGSGTTLVAAERTGRRWIGVDSSMKAVETTLRRLAQGSEPMGDYVRGKNGRARQPALFHTGELRGSFDLYVAEGAVPRRPPAQCLRQWADLFPSASATIFS